MQRLSLVDESFDVKLTREYNLSILVSQDGFSFSILDAVKKRAICLFHQDTFATEPGFHLKKLSSIYDEVELLSLPYKKVKIYFSIPEKTTLIPIEVFQTELAEEFYRLTFDPGKNGKILVSLVPEMAGYAIYEVDRAVHGLLQEKHSGAPIHSELVLSAFGCPAGIPFLKIRILRKQLVIQSLQDELNFYNSYYYEGENDMLYYILGTVKNMDLKPETLILEGMISQRESVYHRLKQYFNRVEVAVNNPRIQYCQLLQRLPDARFTNLFNSFSII